MPFNLKNSYKAQLKMLGAASIALLASACDFENDDDDSDASAGFPDGAIMLAGNDLTAAAKEAFINAQDGDVIVFPEGTFSMSDTLTFDGDSDGDGVVVKNITIMGYGQEETVLDFTNSVTGDGMLIQNGQNITIKDLSVNEAPNNGIKLKDTDGIIIRNVATVWGGELDEDNGAYGLYPVECSNILIEDTYVRGSADAGIYVGQSENIVVRNSVALENVAGIEIENSKNADVYGNVAEKNTGGILVFDLPIGNGIYGSGVRVFDNEVIDNNTKNFASVSSNPGGVHIVPPGTGIIILSTSDVEIFNNTVTDHKTAAVAITSFLLADDQVAATPDANVGTSVLSYGDIHPYAEIYMDGWSPMVRGINIHDNAITNPNVISAPEGSLINDLIFGYAFAGNEVPEILYDGIGELLSNIPATGGGVYDMAAGINQIAAGLYTNVLEPMGDTSGVKQIPSLDIFGAYAATDRVCQSNNGGVAAGAVYLTNPADVTFNGSDPMPSFAGSDNTMTCDDTVTPFVGTAAVVTVGNETFGCGTDDTTSTFCSN